MERFEEFEFVECESVVPLCVCSDWSMIESKWIERGSSRVDTKLLFDIQHTLSSDKSISLNFSVGMETGEKE